MIHDIFTRHMTPDNMSDHSIALDEHDVWDMVICMARDCLAWVNMYVAQLAK